MTISRPQKISLIVDGDTVIKSNDIIEIPQAQKSLPINEVSTFGDSAIPVLPTNALRNLAVTVYSSSDADKILLQLYNERESDNPNFHTFTLYDGAEKTFTYSDALVDSFEDSMSKTDGLTCTYYIKAVKLKIDFNT
jgi:hypothetical protein